MASIPELGDGQVTWEVECLDRLYLNGYIGPVATSGGWVTFMREQRGKPIPSPGVLGQVTEKFREAGKAMAERERIPLYPFAHKERKDEVANDFRRKRETRDGVVFVGVAQEKARAFQGKKIENKGIAWEAREFFEAIVRDTLDLGRPDRVPLVCDRVVTKKTPGAVYTRVIQDGWH